MLSVALTGWYIGFIITGVVITVVVVLVATILGLARRIGSQAAAVEAALEASRVNTLALWEVTVVNDSVGQIIKHAATARAGLEDA